ncbi:hypothetical protein NLU13_8806 [Sarocladium strictum]|uniref:Zn(2)-C6 fungal-type domain-containing protein n=1 Tax=Sarocladium strictum TaxID=5046 RepID=A0AA39G911_SARSR|nr:hypothetical protein NLU13_8806 [Sarocladium strictum]
MEQPARAYRSHLQPACLPCRRRKSRCHNEASGSCLMCQAHGTDCIYPPNPRSLTEGSRRRRRGRQNTASAPTSRVIRAASGSRQPAPVFDSPEDQQNLHIIGPTGANDTQVLSDYLSRTPGASLGAQNLIPVPASRSRSIFFTRIDKRPLGINLYHNPAAEKLETIERIIEPWGPVLRDVYFAKVNPCFPVFEEKAFREQTSKGIDKVSPALLACLNAHALVYWSRSPVLRDQYCPNGRYIWNLANEALYSELHLQPSISIIQAIILNVGGRPTTSLMGNAALLGAAVSMANSLGLNRNPMGWDIPSSQRNQRMRIWWTLLFYDRWSSLTHGTPPRISRDHYDVPAPTIDCLCEEVPDESGEAVAEVFIALMSLTEVLNEFLQRIYRIHGQDDQVSGTLELQLNRWVESLRGRVRHIVVRGTSLNVPGSANLRLSYLAIRLLAQRIALESTKQSTEADRNALLSSYFQARQTAEDIVSSSREFGPFQSGDFWPSVSAFVYPATVSFLLRCALESCDSARDIAKDASFRIARDLLEVIKGHKEKHGWDLADLCLAQHSGIVEKICREATPDDHSATQESENWHDFLMSDTSFLDQFFPSFWDPPGQEPLA